MRKFEYLTVLDFTSGKVCVYSLSSWKRLEMAESARYFNDAIEDFINRHHCIKDCEWMVHDKKPELWAKGLSYE